MRKLANYTPHASTAPILRGSFFIALLRLCRIVMHTTISIFHGLSVCEHSTQRTGLFFRIGFRQNPISRKGIERSSFLVSRQILTLTPPREFRGFSLLKKCRKFWGHIRAHGEPIPTRRGEFYGVGMQELPAYFYKWFFRAVERIAHDWAIN